MRKQKTFWGSPHSLLLTGFTGMVSVCLIAFLLSQGLFFIKTVSFGYLFILVMVAFFSFKRTKNISVAFGAMLLMPFHHFSVLFGVIKGMVLKREIFNETKKNN